MVVSNNDRACFRSFQFVHSFRNNTERINIQTGVRLLLMFAFVNEVIDTIRLEALKDRLHLLVEKRFRGELNRCQGCAICK